MIFGPTYKPFIFVVFPSTSQFRFIFFCVWAIHEWNASEWNVNLLERRQKQYTNFDRTRRNKFWRFILYFDFYESNSAAAFKMGKFHTKPKAENGA